MSENIAVVVNHPEQADHAWRELKENCILFCVSISCHNYCQQKQYRSVAVDDALLHGSHKAINQWGFGSTFGFFAKLTLRGKERVFLESIFTAIKAVFVQIIKTVLALDILLKDRAINEFVFFDDKQSVFLSVCIAYLKQFCPSIRVRIWPSTTKKESRRLSLKKLVLECLAFLSNIFFGVFYKTCYGPHEIVGVASGGLNHLEEVIRRIHHRKGHRIIFCEDSFNIQKFNFCIKNRIAFVVLPKGRKAFVPDLDALLPFPEGTFIFEGRDLSLIASAVLRDVLKQGVYRFSFDYESALRLFQRPNVRFCLLDEDSVQRRMLAILAWQLNRNSYVVSHGVPAVLMPADSDPSLAGRYPSSVTFVNSEFEKFAYRRIYFDSKKLPVTGTPRYDAGFRLREKRGGGSGLPRPSVKQVLYCGALLKDFDFSFPIDVIGSSQACGFYTKRYIRDIFSAMAPSTNVCLKLKPHYDDENLWRLHLSSFEKKAPYELLTHNANIFEHLLASDLVITSESTVIFEALMFNKPVIVLNYSPEELCLPYDDGLILQARNKQDLTEMICQALEGSSYLESLAKKRVELYNRYAGNFDGHNADRVVHYICEAEAFAAGRIVR